MTARNLRLVPAVALLVLLVGYVARAQSETEPPAKLSSSQQRQVDRLVGRFRRARKDPQERAQIVQEAMQFGRPAVVALYGIIAREIYPRLKAYRNRFQQQALIATKKKIGRVDLEEVARLRATVLGLQHAANFTKEAIVRKGDPAMKRLAEIFLVHRAEVLAQSKALQSERVKLQSSGLLWQQCAVYLYRLMPKGNNKPKEPFSFEKYLQGEEDLAIGLAAPMSGPTRQVLLANSRMAAQLEPEEARGILALNLTRNLLGLPPLAIDLRLCAAARDHSQDMRRLEFFAHTSPVSGKASPWGRAERFGTKAAAENIYHGAHDGRTAHRAWFHSPGHHKNLLGKYTRVGLGRSGAYFTELFGR